MFKIDYKNKDWYYLLFCAVYLTLGLTGWKVGFLLAIVMAGIHIIHSLIECRRLTVFTVQVRLAYLLLLLAAWPEPMIWLYWLPTIGTWAYIFFSYCLLARILSLLPFNSNQTFSIGRLRETLLARPVNNIMNPA
jgi:hypothetical protein